MGRQLQVRPGECAGDLQGSLQRTSRRRHHARVRDLPRQLHAQPPEKRVAHLEEATGQGDFAQLAAGVRRPGARRRCRFRDMGGGLPQDPRRDLVVGRAGRDFGREGGEERGTVRAR